MTNQAMQANLDHIQQVLATHNNAVSAKRSADRLRQAQAASDLAAALKQAPPSSGPDG